MMKAIFSLCLLFLFSCSKNKADLGPNYQQFIGKWKCINSSERVEIDVKDKGIIQIFHEIERTRKLIVQKWRYSDTLEMYGTTWIGFGFLGKNDASISLFLNGSKDSLYCGSLGTNINDNQIVIPDNPQIFVRSN